MAAVDATRRPPPRPDRAAAVGPRLLIRQSRSPAYFAASPHIWRPSHYPPPADAVGSSYSLQLCPNDFRSRDTHTHTHTQRRGVFDGRSRWAKLITWQQKWLMMENVREICCVLSLVNQQSQFTNCITIITSNMTYQLLS